MIKALFYIDGNLVEAPMNTQELAIELNFGKDQFPNAGTVNITDLVWVRENYDLLTKHIDDGLTGGSGIFEGPSLRIDFTDGEKTLTVFNGFIDLTTVQIQDRVKVVAKSISHSTVDWLNQVASGFTFEYLASLNDGDKGYISPDLYKFMPYVNNTVPNYLQSAVLSLMIYNVTQAIVKEIEDIVKLISEVAGYFTTIPAIIKIIIKILYLIALTIVLVKLVKDCIKFIISPVKYHAGMYVRDLFERGCDYLNMDFESEIFSKNSEYYNEFILPQKFYNPPSTSDNQILGFLKEDKNEQVGYYKGTFAQFIEAMKVKYCAKIIVQVPQGGATATNRGKVIFIRKDKSATQPVYQLPDIYEPNYTTNADELFSNTLIEYQIDPQDTNTLQNYSGTIYQVITQPKTVVNRPFVMLKNYNNVAIQFSRASEKTDLTVPEKIIKGFLKVFETIANAIVTVINAVITAINVVIKVVKQIFGFFGIKLKLDPIPKLKKLELSSSIENRKGMLMLSSDYFGVPKIFILQEGSASKYHKIHPDNYWLESARAMYDKFHFANSFLPSAERPTGNQYLIKNLQKVPFDIEDLLLVLENNRILGPDGSEAVIESLKFSYYNPQAEIRVRYPKIITNNLYEKYLEPDGQ